MHLQVVIVQLLHPGEKAGALPPKGNCFCRKKKKKEEIIFHADFPSEQEEQESSGDSQLEVKGGC